MLTCLPEIVVDEFAAPATKRRRLNTPHAESVTLASDHEVSAQTSPPSASATTEELGEDTLVCYGMVSRALLTLLVYAYLAQISDLKAHSLLHHATSLTPTPDAIRFEPPRTIFRDSANTPVARLDDFGGELLLRLAADDELVLQLSLFSAPIAPPAERRTLKSTFQYLGATIYGPKRRSGDVGDFLNQAGCYLDDPVGCDRNVPYMNPQCLFTLHETPPMTFDLLQSHELHIDSFSRTSLDVLSRFETTDEFELSASPTALRTELKEYVDLRGRVTPVDLRSKASETSPDFLPATRTRYAPKQRWCWYMAAEDKRGTIYVRMPELSFQDSMLNLGVLQFCERCDW